MLNFCTLFNSTYLSRGLAMYESLEEHCPSFSLYIFAFDQDCFDALTKLSLKNATIISLHEFEDEKLLTVKPARSSGEYCWTCTPSTILYCIEKYNLNECTYIDADLLFFSDPKILIEELGESHSVLITEHRYTLKYDQTLTSGKYCVQFITFKNDKNGLIVLNWWRDACLEWCFNRLEDNKFGDQKYLDDWLTRFEGVKELQNLGGGVAPWNVQQYTFIRTNNQVIGKEISSGKNFNLIFYHFHDFKYAIKNIFLFANSYILNNNVTKFIYKPYVNSLVRAEAKIKTFSPIRSHEEINIDWFGHSLRRTLRINLFGHYKNYYRKNYLLK
jgi:hypothetical protein